MAPSSRKSTSRSPRLQLASKHYAIADSRPKRGTDATTSKADSGQRSVQNKGRVFFVSEEQRERIRRQELTTGFKGPSDRPHLQKPVPNCKDGVAMGIACDHCTHGKRPCFIPNIEFPAFPEDTVRLPTCLSCKEHRRCCVPPLRQAPPTASALQKRASRVKLARKAAQTAATNSTGGAGHQRASRSMSFSTRTPSTYYSSLSSPTLSATSSLPSRDSSESPAPLFEVPLRVVTAPTIQNLTSATPRYAFQGHSASWYPHTEYRGNLNGTRSPVDDRPEMMSYSPDSVESQPGPMTPPSSFDDETRANRSDNDSDTMEELELSWNQSLYGGLHGIDLLSAIAEKVLDPKRRGQSGSPKDVQSRQTLLSDDDTDSIDLEYDADGEDVRPATTEPDPCCAEVRNGNARDSPQSHGERSTAQSSASRRPRTIADLCDVDMKSSPYIGSEAHKERSPASLLEDWSDSHYAESSVRDKSAAL